MNKIDKFISNKLIELRIEKELTQQEVADMIDMKSRVSVVNMENGKQSFTSKTIYLLACIFNKEVSYFFPPIAKTKITKQRRKVVKIVTERKFIVKGIPKVD